MQLNDQTIGPFLAAWHEERHKCRTDLLYLCQEVLGYKDVSRRVHGPILDALQHFPGANEEHKTVADFTAAMRGKVLWEPLCQMEHLPANEGFEQSRDNLILFPRGHIKTTIVSVAHSIQWILNYPNVRILGTTATETLITSIVLEIRNHFTTNEQLRQLFPELCPQSKDGKIPEFGNLSGFTCPAKDNNNKRLGPGGKEPTFLATTVGSAITGYHGDVQKTDDAVEKINSSSQAGIDEVIRHSGSMGDLLEKYNSVDENVPLAGWKDMVGTPWDFSDLYQLRRNYHAKCISDGLKPPFNLIMRSAAPNWPEGPYLWPERMGYAALKSIEDDPEKGPGQLSAQYLMTPIILGQGLLEDASKIRWIDEIEMNRRMPRFQLVARLDLAGMDANAKGLDNDYTCLTLGGFSDGVLHVPFMRHGRPPTEEVVEWIFELFAEFPHLPLLRVEKASGASPLESWLRREMSARDKWLPVEFVPRSNQQSKVNRIKGLRPWFQSGKIVFSQRIPYRTYIELEIKGFPKYRHDDILDTISDLMIEAKGAISGNVLVDGDSEIPMGTLRTGLDTILAQMDRDYYPQDNYVDADTGFAC